MPRPIFDIEQYELRGVKPEAYSQEQHEKLEKTLSRVHGQIDWTAQLLGFSGDKYWGRPTPTADGTYNWHGLPETMNHKRQMQTGAFGIYNKDKDYVEWPAPFNRTNIKGSGDASIHIFERDGNTILSPLGQGESIDYMTDPVLFANAQYEFDRPVEILINGEPSKSIRRTTFYVADQLWTRIIMPEDVGSCQVSIIGSEALPAYVQILPWSDISDWDIDEVQKQFLGIWGNKGNQLSMDFAFDALELHGYNEAFGAVKIVGDECFDINDMLASIGLKPTIWTPYWYDKFCIRVSECYGCAEAPYEPGKEPKPPSTIPNPCGDPIPNWDRVPIETCDYACGGLTVEFSQNLTTPKPWDERPDCTDYDNGFYDGRGTGDRRQTFDNYTDFTTWFYNFVLDGGDVDDLGSPRKLYESGLFNFEFELTEEQLDYWPPLDHIPQYGCPPCGSQVHEPIMDNGEFDIGAPAPDKNVIDGIYDKEPDSCDIGLIDYYPGLKELCVKYEVTAECKVIDGVEIEWVVDPTLDNGLYCITGYEFPCHMGPWAIADGGECPERVYCEPPDPCQEPPPREPCGLSTCRTDPPVECAFNPDQSTGLCGTNGPCPNYECLDGVAQGPACGEYGQWCGFDGGVFEKVFSLSCSIGDTSDCIETCPDICDPVDGDLYQWPIGPPDYLNDPDNNCTNSCLLVDNGEYRRNWDPPAFLGGPDGSSIVDGCVYEWGGRCEPIGAWCSAYGPCDPADDGIYSLVPTEDDCPGEGTLYCCNFDNELYPPGFLGEPCFGEVIDGCIYAQLPITCVPDCWIPVPTRCEELHPIRIDLTDEFNQNTFVMQPALRNALTPLRVWKNDVLTVIDEVPADGMEYYNFLVADFNRGAEPEDSYRYFVRLPLEYTRNGKEWNKAVAVCDNQGYFSSFPTLAETNTSPAITRCPIYSALYWWEPQYLERYTLWYDEDFLYSSWREDPDELELNWVDAKISPEDDDRVVGFDLAEISSYDPYALRIPNEDGSWKGHYFYTGRNPTPLTGYLVNDILERRLTPYLGTFLGRGAPVYDRSAIECPNVEFPDPVGLGVDLAPVKNYVVCYAYFAADFSAADDPCFDPDKPYNWREPSIICSDLEPPTTPDIEAEDVPDNSGLTKPLAVEYSSSEMELVNLAADGILAWEVEGNGSNNPEDFCPSVCYSTNTAYRLHVYSDWRVCRPYTPWESTCPPKLNC